MAEVIAIEARALGVTQLFAPMSDLARELRYGRVSTWEIRAYSILAFSPLLKLTHNVII